MAAECQSVRETSRREFIQAGIAVTGATIGSSFLPANGERGNRAKPNILFIYTEGQRADALGLAGNSLLQTPNMDRIGREGAWFKNSFCTNSLCAPARATALTGLYSRMTGALDNKHPDQLLPADIPIFTDLLHQAGYEVAIAGKVHVKNGVRERYWDYYFGFNAPVTDYYKPKFREGRDGQVGEDRVYDGYADDLVTDRAISWLNEKRDKPFCLLLWYQTPHAPFFRARRHLDLYNGTPIPKPSTFDDDLKGYPGKPSFLETDIKIGTVENLNASRTLEEVVKDYCAGLVAVDENIGRVFNCLEAKGQLDETAILLSSDHGFFLGEWRLYDKRFMHEPSIRVPTLLRYPERIKAGTIRSEMILDVDIAPTILELTGLPTPDHMQGRSLLDLIDENAKPWRNDWLYHYYEYPRPGYVQPHVGVRTDRYKLIHYYQTNAFELYDLSTDPGELHNLYGQKPVHPIQEELRSRLSALRQEFRDV